MVNRKVYDISLYSISIFIVPYRLHISTYGFSIANTDQLYLFFSSVHKITILVILYTLRANGNTYPQPRRVRTLLFLGDDSGDQGFLYYCPTLNFPHFLTFCAVNVGFGVHWCCGTSVSRALGDPKYDRAIVCGRRRLWRVGRSTAFRRYTSALW